MHPGQMIALAIVFYGKFVIGGKLQLKAAVRAAVIQRAVKFGPTRDELRMHLSEIWRIAGDIDEHHIAPDMAAHLIQAKIFFDDAGVRVLARSAHMRGGDQLTLGGIAP